MTRAPQTPNPNSFILSVVIGPIVAVIIAHDLGALPFLAFQNRRTNWRAISTSPSPALSIPVQRTNSYPRR